MTVSARRWTTRTGEVRESWTYDFRHRRQRYVEGGFHTESDARQAEAIRKGRLYDERLRREYGIRSASDRAITVREVIDQEWLPDAKARLAASTYSQAVSHAKKLRGWFGASRFGDITLRTVEGWRDGLGASPNQLREELKWFRMLLRFSRGRGYLDHYPLDGLRLPRATRPPDRILTEAEQGKLLTEIRAPAIRRMIELGLWTGL